MQQIPGKIEIIGDSLLEVKFNGMFPRQSYHVVATSLKSNHKDNFNIEHASVLQKSIIDGLLELKNPTLDAIPLINKISFNKDSNVWRIEIFSIKIADFGDTIPQRIKETFEEVMNINWGLRF